MRRSGRIPPACRSVSQGWPPWRALRLGIAHLIPLAAKLRLLRRRAVSKFPGKDYDGHVLVGDAARDACHERGETARAPLDRSSPAMGILTLCEVILTIRPKPRVDMESMTF